MARNKKRSGRIRYQCKSAAKSIDRVLDHLMAADVLAKGGEIDGHGKLLPTGVDLEEADKAGHPVLNEWMPVLVQLLTGAKDSILRMAKKI